MNDNLPPLPMKSLLYETRDRFDDPLHINGYTAEQMQAYARAAIERQSVPDLNRLAPFVSGLGKSILQEFIEDMAAAPQPQPVQEPVMYQFRWTNPAGQQVNDTAIEWTQVEPRWNGTVQEKCAELLSHRYGEKPCYEVRALYTSPQAQPLIEVLTELESMYDKADQITPLHKGMRMAISTACDRVNAVMKKHGITKGTT